MASRKNECPTAVLRERGHASAFDLFLRWAPAPSPWVKTPARTSRSHGSSGRRMQPTRCPCQWIGFPWCHLGGL